MTGPDLCTGPWFQYFDAVGFEWNTYRVAIRDLPQALEGFRIVQLSDLHCQRHWQTAYDELIDRLRADPPDLLVITGDVVDEIRTGYKCLPIARRLINGLSSRLDIYGIFGNHDAFLKPRWLSDTKLKLMDGQRVIVPAGDVSLELIAPHGPEREDYVRGFEKTIPPRQAGVPRIILSHYPDHIRKMDVLQPDVFLSGHTHGGQACLPGRIPLLRHDSLPMKLCHGVHRFRNTWLFVSRGMGFSTLPFRAFCPAEVVEVRLSAGSR